MDFSPEDLFDTIERLLSGLLERAGVDRPPVDVLAIATDHLGIPVEYTEPTVDDHGRRRAGFRRDTGGITLTDDMTPEQQNTAAANGVARALLPDVLRKLGIASGTESKQAASHIRGLIAPRLLVPTKLLRGELRTCGFDVLKLQARFRSATAEVVAQRLLDLDEPCVITIADDGVAMAAAELQRHRLERFSVLLSTIITASPMIGILGTVIGIIKSFNVLGAQTQLADPRGVSGGIGEALITTACGLAVALFTLFPYMSFKGLADRAMGRMESVIAAAQTGLPRRPAPVAGEPEIVKA